MRTAHISDFIAAVSTNERGSMRSEGLRLILAVVSVFEGALAWFFAGQNPCPRTSTARNFRCSTAAIRPLCFVFLYLRQGNDIGTQYRSAVFVNSQEHKLIAQKIREEMQQKWNPHRVVTEINGKDDPGVDSTFWIAEPYHQLYLEKNPGGYCNHRQRF